MSAELSPLSSANAASSWTEAALLCRRICLMRADGRGDEANHLEATTLPSLVDRLRQAEPAAADCEARLAALFKREAERVADARALAEILLPLLRDEFSAGPVRGENATTVRAPASEPVLRRSQPPAAPSIADFIDEMIQQQPAARIRAGS